MNMSQTEAGKEGKLESSDELRRKRTLTPVQWSTLYKCKYKYKYKCKCKYKYKQNTNTNTNLKMCMTKHKIGSAADIQVSNLRRQTIVQTISNGADV